MLQLVYGRAGTGKTEYLMQSLCKKAQQGHKIMLLVPEQASFETEKAVFRRVGPSKMMDVEVLSFTSLCDLIFRTCGGMVGQRLDEPTRLMMMSAALDEVSSGLDLYKQSAHDTSFLKMLMQAVSLFKYAGISPTRLEESAASLPSEESAQLGKKLKELSLIYSAFEAMIDRRYADPLDDISRASRLAAEYGFFSGWDVYIDGFTYFSAVQLDLLKVALEDCEEMMAAFCGLPEHAGNPNSIFFGSLKASKQLEQAAAAAFTDICEPVVLKVSRRFSQSGLAAAEALLCGAQIPQNSADGIKLVRCKQPYDEVEYAAAEISRLVREEGLRYRDIAVICRGMDRYRPAVETVFERYDIPVFMDCVTDLRSHPLIVALLSALEAVRGGWDTAQLLNLAKTPAFGLTVDQACKLENYCFVWSVEGKMWEEDFKVSPNGLQGSDKHQDEAALAELNEIRRRLIEPLTSLRELSRGCTGLQFAKGCYAFLQKVGCADHLKNFCDSMPEEERKAARELCQLVWENTMSLLNVFAAALEQIVYPLGRFSELMQLAVSLIEVGQIPTTLDQVSFGAADRVRPQGTKAVFLLGANDGVFPAAAVKNSIFSEKEYALMADTGIDIEPPVFQKVQEERLYFYRAACCASKHICILYAANEPAGEQLIPSAPVQQLIGAFPETLVSAQVNLEHRVVNRATAEEELARHFVHGDPFAATIVEFLKKNSDEEMLNRLSAARLQLPSGDISPESASGLFHKEMYLSASRVEAFYRCSFHYFCRYGLGVESLRRAEFSPLESGSAIHYVLEQMLLRYGGKPLFELDEKQLHDEVVELLDRYLDGLVTDQTVLGDRKLYLFHRMVSILVRVLRRLGAEFAQSVFQPAGMEVKVGPDGPVQPLEAEGKNGIKVSVRGSIDRVDLMEDESGRYARVVDYKSGGKKFELTDVFYGLNMQMLIYLFALCEGGLEKFADCKPAGILYFPAKTAVQNLPRETDDGLVNARVDGEMAMNGLLLRDQHILKAMEAALAGEFFPVKQKKEDQYTGEAMLADAAELEKIRKHVHRLLARMGEELYSGKIAPSPADGIEGEVCRYCEYAALCHRSRMGDYKGNPEIKREDFYGLLDQEEKKEDAE